MGNTVIRSIVERRSVREFLDKKVKGEKLLEILNAGRWTPSGKNNQAWRFIVVNDKRKLKELAKLTFYGNIIENAPACITVFLDADNVYDRTKDVQSVGACIQNMLLAAHSLEWCLVGEILKNRDKVGALLEAPDSFELMAVVAIGYPEEHQKASIRRPLDQIAWLNKYGNNLELKSVNVKGM